MKCAMHVNECCYDVVSGYKRGDLPTPTEDESYVEIGCFIFRVSQGCNRENEKRTSTKHTEHETS